MKEFLCDMFRFNCEANLNMITFVRDLEANENMLGHLSHLANSQYKWLDRLMIFPEASTLDWWMPAYDKDEINERLKESANQWVAYLEKLKEDDLDKEMNYVGYDGSVWFAKLKDIALQLTFHSFHHRAQIQMMIRAQGITPAFIDYIGYRAQKKEAS